MSCSTQNGFSEPETPGCRTVASVKVVPECLFSVEYPAAPDAFASDAVGVGHCFRVSACTTSLNGRALRSNVSGLAAPLFQSRAVGVGQFASATAQRSGLRPRSTSFFAPSTERTPFSPRAAVGVGQLTATPSDMPCFPASCDGLGFFCRFSFGDARGVGQNRTSSRNERTIPPPVEPFESADVGVAQFSSPREDEDPFASVRGIQIGRSEMTPFNIVPACGKGPEDRSECFAFFERPEPRDVFEDAELRSEFIDDSECFGPEPSIVGGSEASAGDRGWLARDSAAEKVDLGELMLDDDPACIVGSVDLVADCDMDVFDVGVLNAATDESMGS